MSNPLDALKQTVEESQAELENIYQKQGESEEEFYARKLRVQQNYTNAVKNLKQAEVNTYVQTSNAMMSALNSFANMKETQLRDDVKRGKKSEKEAEAEFKKYKVLQYATTWISTLGAVAQIWSDASLGPWFVKAALSASQLVAGAATCAQINRTEIGSADANGNSVVTPMISNAQVTPILDESVDVTRMTNVNTEQRNRSEERVYIVEQDIQDSGRKVEIRDKESTF
jgi:ABC-type multidrug transport system fused ATPase/permease subunit